MILSIHSLKERLSKKRSLGVVVALVMLVTAIVGTTAAYLFHSSDPVKNTFTPSQISCDIEETVSGGVKSSVKVKNTGKTAAYIRVAVIANSVDEEGAITGAANVNGFLCNTGWAKGPRDMYYYYTKPVAPDESTDEFLNRAINLDGKQVTILAEAIQAAPAEAAFEAWGVAPATLSPAK